jgi:hypothetical protein
MIYDKQLNTSYKQVKKFSLTGCKNLYLSESKNVKGYFFEDRQISAFDRTENFSLWQNLTGLNISIKTLQSKNGTLYDISVGFAIATLRTDTTHLLDILLNTELTAIVEDRNGRFWLLGFKQGFVTDYEAKTEDGVYTVTMKTQQIAKYEEVSVVAMKTLTLATTDTNFTPEPAYYTPVREQIYTTKTYNTKIVTENNYVIKENHDFVILPLALTVFLPTSETVGKQIIIKCDYDASVTSSFVKGQIDNNTQIEMNTDRATITVIWNGNIWSLTNAE